jgi:hypothetical protein
MMSHFYDISDLFAYVNNKRAPASGAMIKDYITDLNDARKAFYVCFVKKFNTPTGWWVLHFGKINVPQKTVK